MLATSRIQREIQAFRQSPPDISIWPTDDSLTSLHAQLVGLDQSPYAGGVFQLTVNIPERYPFEPPCVKFVTRVYHPNVDNQGRICLDVLKMPPKGTWNPSLNLLAVVKSIQLLLSEPNPDDPLDSGIARMYKQEYPLFLKHAAEWTKLYANASQGNIGVDTKKAADKASSEENENNVDIPAKSANKGSSTAATGISESEKRPLGAISIKHPTKRSLKRKQPVSEPENDIHSDKR